MSASTSATSMILDEGGTALGAEQEVKPRRSRKGIPRKLLILSDDKCCSSTSCKYDTLDDGLKVKILSDFYELQDYDKQNAYLFELIRKSKCTRVYREKRSNPMESRRSVSYKYFVKSCGTELEVCSKAFRKLYSISEKRVRTARGERRSSREHLIEE